MNVSYRTTLIWFRSPAEPYCPHFPWYKVRPSVGRHSGAPELGSQSDIPVFIPLRSIIYSLFQPNQVILLFQDRIFLPPSSVWAFAPSPWNTWKALEAIPASPSPKSYLSPLRTFLHEGFSKNNNKHVSFLESLLCASSHFLLTKPWEADVFIPSLKIATLKLGAILRICLSLHSTGRVGFESSAKACPLTLPAIIPSSTVIALCAFWGQWSYKLAAEEMNLAMDRIWKLSSKMRRSEILDFELLLKMRKFWQHWVCIPTWPWSRGAVSQMPLHMGLGLSPCLAEAGIWVCVSDSTSLAPVIKHFSNAPLTHSTFLRLQTFPFISVFFTLYFLSLVWNQCLACCGPSIIFLLNWI